MVIDNPSATPPTYECLFEESTRQKLDPDLILAVMRQEAGKLGTFSFNAKSGTWDIGPLQINSWWLKRLSKMTKRTELEVASALAFDGCWNLATGVWVLRTAINEAGGSIWDGVSKYNARNPVYGNAYALKVYGHYLDIKKKNPTNALTAYAAPMFSVTKVAPKIQPGTVQPRKQSQAHVKRSPANHVWLIDESIASEAMQNKGN